LALVNAASSLLVHVALGGDLSAAFGVVPDRLGALTGGSATGAALPGLAAVGLGVLLGVAALVVWVELLVRSLLVYLLVAFIPLGLAGLFWSETSRWLRRLIEMTAAVMLSQLVVVTVMTLAAADLSHGPLSTSDPAATADTVLTGVGLVILASLALPVALRVVPHATEAAVAAGAGSRLAAKLPGPVGGATGSLRASGSGLAGGSGSDPTGGAGPSALDGPSSVAGRGVAGVGTSASSPAAVAATGGGAGAGSVAATALVV
jgi:hypothetical protein